MCRVQYTTIINMLPYTPPNVKKIDNSVAPMAPKKKVVRIDYDTIDLKSIQRRIEFTKYG